MAVSFDRPASEVVRRYAGALFSLVGDRQERARICTELETLSACIAEDNGLSDVLKNSVISRSGKARALVAIAEKSGFSRLVKNFVCVVANNGRARQLPDMIGFFKILDARERGVQRVLVLTARPLTQNQRRRLMALLDRQIGKEVDLVAETDPALVGGICLRIGSRLIDASLATRLAHLNNAMEGV